MEMFMNLTTSKCYGISVLLIFILIAATGCASVDVTKTGMGFHEPTNPNDVKILKTIPRSEYVELGTVTVTHFPAAQSAKMHNAIRTESAVIGADAVVLTDEGIYGNYRWATGVALKFK